MTKELYWLALTAMITALFWLPYIANRTMVRGMPRALGNPLPDDKPHSSWAERMMRAHTNAIENLVIFAILVLVAHAAKISNSTTIYAVQLYFWARMVHFVVFALGIPVARTLAFAVGVAAQAMIALTILGWI